MTFLRLPAFVFFLGISVLQAQPTPLDPMVTRPDLWQVAAPQLENDLKTLRFEWTSAAQDTARSVSPSLTFSGYRVYEALLQFNNQKPVEARLLIYNRGDAGELNRRQFEKLIEDASKSLTSLTGKEPFDRGRDATSAVKAEGYVWDTDTTHYVLEWSATKESQAKGVPFRAEFVRLTIKPRDTTVRPIGSPEVAGGSRAAVKKFVGSAHVEKLPSGAKIKGMPMVDQGQKGYCAVATVERVMRYYGATVDQHELAQAANSSASGGTSQDAMLQSMKKLTARLGVKMKTLYEWDIREFLKLVDDYNRAAKRAKVSEVALGGSVIDIGECLRQMKPEIYKEVRLKKTADFGKFQREIQRNIDEGLPLVWSVQLGMVKEKEIPQTVGGHMRLIIGYDNAAKEIIYSDSWGLGHEEKRMSFEDAWTITTGLSSIQPLS